MPDGKRQAGLPEARPGATGTRVSAPGWKADPQGGPEGGRISSNVREGMEGWEGDSGCGPDVAGSPETAFALA